MVVQFTGRLAGATLRTHFKQWIRKEVGSGLSANKLIGAYRAAFGVAPRRQWALQQIKGVRDRITSRVTLARLLPLQVIPSEATIQKRFKLPFMYSYTVRLRLRDKTTGRFVPSETITFYSSVQGMTKQQVENIASQLNPQNFPGDTPNRIKRLYSVRGADVMEAYENMEPGFLESSEEFD